MLKKSLLASGILATIIFPTVVTVATFFYPGYSSLADPISMLGEQGFSHAWILNLFGFLVRGLLVIAFAIGLDLSIDRHNRRDRLGIALLIGYGIASIGASVFNCDMNCVVPALTFSGSMHVVVGAFAFFTPALATLQISRRFSHDPLWRQYSLYSRVSGLLIIAALVAFVIAQTSYPSLEGLAERLISLAIMQWMLVVAIHGILPRRPTKGLEALRPDRV